MKLTIVVHDAEEGGYWAGGARYCRCVSQATRSANCWRTFARRSRESCPPSRRLGRRTESTVAARVGSTSPWLVLESQDGALVRELSRSWFPAQTIRTASSLTFPWLPSGREGRLCDKEARRRLGRRASTVFPPPVRAALAAATYEDANRISREESGKGMTKQTFAILPKIREVDCLLRKSEKARHIIREVPPGDLLLGARRT